MTNDRQLLELAAFAAGLRLEWDGDPRDWRPMYYEGKTYHEWNPLTDDSDALRLAVKLGMTLQRGLLVDKIYTGITHKLASEDIGDNPYAATRRAIVRAAAKIGKAIP
jgi:hypothetical protein